MKEIFKEPKTALAIIAIAAGAYAMGEYDKVKTEVAPIPGSEKTFDNNDEKHIARYYDDGTRTVTVLNTTGTIKLLYRQHCERFLLGDEALETEVLEPTTVVPSSEADFELQFGVSAGTDKCKDERLTPSDFRPDEIGIE